MNDSRQSILLVEDDVALAQLIGDYLTKHGYDVTTLHRGDTALLEIPIRNPDLVVLDLMLPGLDGLSLCRDVKSRYDGPILMLTALSESVDVIVGLETGADDYLAKPVEPRVLLARVRALLRRVQSAMSVASAESEVFLEGHGIRICERSRSLTVDDVHVELTTKEFDLLWLLATHAGKVLSRDELYQRLNGTTFDGVDRSMDNRISVLRKCLQDNPENPQIIKTVRGKGYLIVIEA